MVQNDPDLSLVRALQAGDESALNELIRKYQTPLFHLIYRYLADEELARDLVQETFVRVYFGIARYKAKAKFLTWLYSIATNLCRDHARSKAHHQARQTDSLNDPATGGGIAASGSTPAEDAECRERLAALDAAIDELPHDLKTALILFALEGCSQHECAEALGVSVKTVETRVYRARKILEKRLRLFQ